MKITVFGGSGVTGQLFLEQALEQGHHITAYVRNPVKLKLSHPNLTIVPGELKDVKTLRSAIKGADAVVSALGPTLGSRDLALADGVQNIVTAMEGLGVTRLIGFTTTSFKDKNDKFQLGFHLSIGMVKLLFPYSYKNVVAIGEHFVNSSLDYTLIRIPTLTNKPLTKNINVGYTGDGKIKVYALTKADLAYFMLKQLTNKEWIRKSPAISN